VSEKPRRAPISLDLFRRFRPAPAVAPRRTDNAAAHLATLVASADDAIITKDLDGIITTWNVAAEKLFGYREDEVVGRSITIIIPPERLHEETEILSRLRRGESIQHFETERMRRDGTRIPISLAVSPMRDASGRVFGASKIARDITDRRRAEAAIREALQRLEVLYRLVDEVGRVDDVAEVCEAAVDAIVSVGADRASVLLFDDAGVMRFRAWRNLSDGYRAAVDGHSPWSRDTKDPAPVLIGDVRTDASLGALRDVIAAEGIGALAFVPLTADGRLLGKFMIYYDTAHAFSAAEVRLAETIGHHVAFGLGRLLAEASIANLFAAERAARAEADAANHAKDQFLAVLSHELRTPLNAILGWARLLRAGHLGEAERARASGIIERNAQLQAQLVADLLDVSRIAAGKMEIERIPVDLVLVVREALETVLADAHAKKLAIVTDLDDAAGEVLGEARRLQQVVSNLLLNAIKFTPDGGRVELTLRRHETSARLTVRDTGIGIEPALLARVFDPFEQGDTTTTRRHQGLGLGLAIVRRLVALHGGTIRADSAGTGQGATFTVDLPVLAVRIGPGRAGEETGRAAPAVNGGETQALQVLVVDDQPDARDLLAVVLGDHGMTVHTAGSAAEALEMLAAQAVDVLISDISMPDMDGYQLIESVRALGGRNIRAVAVTAYTGRDVRERALAAGFDAHATKPVDPEDLVHLLRSLAPR
jgi:PAS domain S-box-containing protein